MNLLLIFRKIWRYKLATLPILAFVLALAVYVVAVKPPTYEAGATYMLVNPPNPPTDAQIAANPALGRINADNPYLRVTGQNVVAQVLASRLDSDDARRSLAKQGADPTYVAAPSIEYGFGAPILEITGTGPTAKDAVTTANLVGNAASRELDRLQKARGVHERYRITMETVVPADQAMLKASGKLRALVGVLALGTILMFIVISVLDALSALRAERAGGLIDSAYFDLDGSFDPLATNGSVRPSDPDPDDLAWPDEARR